MPGRLWLLVFPGQLCTNNPQAMCQMGLCLAVAAMAVQLTLRLAANVPIGDCQFPFIFPLFDFGKIGP